ncbi:hypothetical protein N7G274_010609 [Stereocaulon virgatum]|uniref:F-box domain-containing protein n=1 Tax=Stereocaulon virgatum TaxID=373712 RepID=A0ABR3ZT91_9LECA
MIKRPREDDLDVSHSAKRLRTSKYLDRLSVLSDELLLRTLSFLSVSELITCQRLSRRLKALAGDPQLWKALFYDRFVRPRASRIPGVRDLETSAQSLYYSSRISKWLDDDHLVKRGKATNWKRQYKLRHNWSRGSANVSETQVAEQPSIPPLLVRLHEDTVVTVDGATGIRAWSLKGDDRLIASAPLCHTGPTSLATNDTESSEHRVGISIGFEDGRFAIYTLLRQKRAFVQQYTHAASTNGAIHAIAYTSPYLLTMTGAPLLSLYRFRHDLDAADDTILAPTLISSLRSHTAYPPATLAIRASSTSVVASIAYAMPSWTVGWSVGLQELRLTGDGMIMDSRMASALNTISRMPRLSAHSPHNVGGIPLIKKPTSLSYNHPYLLSAHSDNTLTLYMVTSNAEQLSISAGNRLWGHTSSVSGAYVGERGKAVSASTLGNELRVWELEGGIPSSASRRRAAAGEASVQVHPGRRRSFIEEARLDRELEESNVTKGWIAFDEEKVVLLREKMQGTQALVVYDFS